MTRSPDDLPPALRSLRRTIAIGYRAEPRLLVVDALDEAFYATFQNVEPCGKPVLLVLDDIHWADPPTLALLRHLVHETANDRIMVLGTYRDTDIDRSHPLSELLADLRRERASSLLRTTSLPLDLPDHDLARPLRAAAGHDVDLVEDLEAVDERDDDDEEDDEDRQQRDDRSPVRDDVRGDQVQDGGPDCRGVGLDFEASFGDAGRVGQCQVTLGLYQIGRASCRERVSSPV